MSRNVIGGGLVNVSINEGTYKTLTYEKARADEPKAVNQQDTVFLITDSYLGSIGSRIEGTILTIIEAITEDKEKRESTKSIVRRMIWQEMGDIYLLKLEKLNK